MTQPAPSSLIGSIIGFAPPAIAASVITLSITAILEWRRVARDRVNRVVDLYKTFTSKEFLAIRNAAQVIVLTSAPLDLKHMRHNRFEDFTVLTTIAAFYQHVSISYQVNTVKRVLVFDYFGSNFVWWYRNFFDADFGPIAKNWGSAVPLKTLYQNLEKHQVGFGPLKAGRRKRWIQWQKDAADLGR